MKIRTKIILAFLVTFGLVFTVCGLGIHFLGSLTTDSSAILKDNYQTLIYTQEMNFSLGIVQFLNEKKSKTAEDSTQLQQELASFQVALDKQNSNITEQGEKELTAEINAKFQQLKKKVTEGESIQPGLLVDIQTLLDRIFDLNQAVVVRRNEKAQHSASVANWIMTGIACGGIILGFIFLIIFPRMISKPIRAFNQAIDKVSEGKYDIEIPIRSKNEFHSMALAFYKMAEKLKEFDQTSFAEVLSEKKKVETLINHMDQAVIGLDQNKDITFVNHRALSLLGLENQDILGFNVQELSKSNPTMRQIVKELMIGFEPWEEKKYPNLHPKGKLEGQVFAKMVADVVERPTGEVSERLIGHIIILSNITTFAQRDIAKTQFMATLSHELKTPIAAIDLCTGLLGNVKVGQLSLEQQEYLETIRENVYRIRRMINEVLEISKIESGTIDVQLVQLNPNDLMERGVHAVRPFMKEKNLTIDFLLMPNIPDVQADPHKTLWVLNNFLVNAIRYAPVGSVIKISAKEVGKMVELAVTDQGPGVPEDQRDKIFEKFTKLDSQHSEGTGLGLAISKEFVGAMNGNIGLDIPQEGGSKFWVQLPLSAG